MCSELSFPFIFAVLLPCNILCSHGMQSHFFYSGGQWHMCFEEDCQFVLFPPLLLNQSPLLFMLVMWDFSSVLFGSALMFSCTALNMKLFWKDPESPETSGALFRAPLCCGHVAGKVYVSHIVDYLRHTTSRSSEDSGLEELCNMLDPEHKDVSIDLDTYHAVMKEWIDDCRNNGYWQVDLIKEKPSSQVFREKHLHVMST